jgi:hypothetical protein
LPKFSSSVLYVEADGFTLLETQIREFETGVYNITCSNQYEDRKGPNIIFSHLPGNLMERRHILVSHETECARSNLYEDCEGSGIKLSDVQGNLMERRHIWVSLSQAQTYPPTFNIFCLIYF